MSSQHSVCTFCRENILKAQGAWAYHHPSYISLKASAQHLCIFCRLLFSDVFAQLDNLEAVCKKQSPDCEPLKSWLHNDVRHTENLTFGAGSKTTSLYRWNIRKLGRTRESKVMVAVTFRAIPHIIGGNEINQSSSPSPSRFPERVFYCFPETDLGTLLNPAQLGPSTNPDVNDGVQIKNWIRKCGIEHKNCPKRAGAGSKFVPTRLLHVGGKRRGQPIKVVDTKFNNVKGPYVTLSHCWGPPDDTRRDLLKQKTIGPFMGEGIPWEILSKNFRQAIDVARFLEIDYIWIDSLCIIQDDSADWKHEAVLMHKVYRYSYCNIAAADAKDTKGGLFRSRAPHDVLPARMDLNESTPIFDKGTWRIIREDVWDHGLLQRPLYKRGWVFQERMLAPRILHFSRHQIFWDCAEMSACETLPEMLPLPLDRLASTDRHWRGRLQEGGDSLTISEANDELIDDFWRRAIENYTALELTHQFDKRIAVWSIAKLVRDVLKEQYAVGLWELALEEQLAWRVADSTKSQRPEELQKNPSWSWTSVKGKIFVADRLQSLSRDYQVMNHNDEPVRFKIDEPYERPKIPRKQSADRDEELAIMGDELKMVDERRRKSSAASRQNSDTDSTWTYSFAGRKSSILRPVENFTMSPQPTSSTAQTQDTKITSDPSQAQSRPKPGLNRTVSFAKQGAAQEVPSKKQKLDPAMQQKMNAEPELKDLALALKGFVNSGVLRLQTLTNLWTLSPTTGSFGLQEICFDAYPDVMPTKEEESVLFMVLALTRHGEDDEFIGSPSDAPTSDIWYMGQGIILKPLESEIESHPCYVRTGSFSIRAMTEKTWEELQSMGHARLPDSSTTKPANIFLY